MEPDTIERLPEILRAYLSERLPEVRNVTIHNVARSPGGNSRSMWFFDAGWDGDAPVSKQLMFRANESTCFRDEEASLEKEYRIFRALQDTPVPVPANYWYERDPSWAGEDFVIRERVDGDTNFRDLPAESQLAILNHFVEILAAQHNLDWEALGLSFLGAPKDGPECARMVVERWERATQRELLEPQPVMTATMAWLKRNLPTEVDRIVLGQGQVGPGQVLFRDDRVVASLDWESGFIGDPMSDLAYLDFMVRPMIGDEAMEGLITRYGELSGLPIRRDNMRFYTVFQSYWAVSACLAAVNRFATGEMRKTQTLVLGMAAPRSFLRRMERIVREDAA